MNTFEDNINGIVNDLIDDYHKGKEIDKTRIFNHPDKEVIIDILSSLRKVIFPGYFKNGSIKVYTLRNNLSMLIEDVMFKLTKQIAIVFGGERRNEDAIVEKARQITLEFVKCLRKIREYIETDVQAAYEGDPAAYSKDEIIYSYPGLFAILVNRIAHELFTLGVPVIPRMMTEYAHSETGIDIHPGATIGKYFFIDHGTGIVIGETTIIGNNVKIYQGVTLGALSTRGGQKLSGKKRHPTICDNVTIYAGASILGGDTVIGENAVIGGNAFITRSIDADTRVSMKNLEMEYYRTGGNESRKEELTQSDEWYYII